MTDATPYPQLSSVVVLWFIGSAGLVLALVAIGPIVFDARAERKWRSELLAKIDPSNSADLNAEMLKAIRSPADIRGFTRGLIALLIVTLTGIALTAAMFSSASDAGDVRKTIITSLTTVLATLAGFYFGSRTSQNTAEDARRQDPPPPPGGAVPATTGTPPSPGGTEPPAADDQVRRAR